MTIVRGRQERAGYADRVFLNVPVDGGYRPLLWAMVFTVYDCGYVPRCALEENDSGEVRILKIRRLISECGRGIHDISRAGVDRRTGLARFNMPLELGLFLGAKWFGGAGHREKRCLVVDRERHRYQKFCSDISGQDIHEHGGSIEGVVSSSRNWLAADAAGRGVRVPGGAAIVRRYRMFRRELPKACARLQQDMRGLTYVDYQVLASVWVQENPWGA